MIASAVAAGLSVPLASHATNGIMLIGYGAKAQGMGGTQIALSFDAVTAAINPAAASFAEDYRVDAGLTVLNAQARAACCLAPDGQVSEKGYFFIPNLAFNMKLNDEMAYNFGFMGYGGGRSQYPQNMFEAADDAGNLGMEWALAVMSNSIAFKPTENQSVGIGLLIGIQRFRVKGLRAFQTFSAEPSKVTNNGYDWSYGGGVRLGWQGHYLKETLNFGATYQSKLYMTKFDEYSGLFAEQGSLDIPANLALGVAYKPTDNVTIAFDYQYVFYEDVKSIGNRTLPISTVDGDPNQLGQDTGPGFGWKNQSIFKLGTEYTYSKQWTIRAGVNYGEQPINNETGGGEFEVNVLAPAVTEWHLSAGASYTMSEASEITFNVGHAFRNKEEQVIPSDTDLPFAGETIELEMRQYWFDISYGYRF